MLMVEVLQLLFDLIPLLKEVGRAHLASIDLLLKRCDRLFQLNFLLQLALLHLLNVQTLLEVGNRLLQLTHAFLELLVVHAKSLDLLV